MVFNKLMPKYGNVNQTGMCLTSFTDRLSSFSSVWFYPKCWF